MEQKSYMVVASKYELKERDTKKGVGAYKTDGAKEKIHGDKQVPRSWVESRNEQINNEHYIIDEDKTAKMVIEREKNVKLNAENNLRSKVTMADLVDKMSKNMGGQAPITELTAEPDVSQKELESKDAEILKLKGELASFSDKEIEEKYIPIVVNKEGIILPEGEPSKEWILPQLKKYLDDKNIPYHKSCKEERLLEIINENK